MNRIHIKMKHILLISIWIAVYRSVQAQYTEQEDTLNYLSFALNSYKILHNVNVNSVYSPLALSVIYNILYQISSGNSEAKLQEILFPVTRSRLAKYDILQRQVESLAQITLNPSTKLANKFYHNNSIEFDTTFKYLAERYQTASERIDLSRIEAARNTINKWVESRTNGQIMNFVQNGKIQKPNNMIIVNTLHFEAEWLRKYSDDQIRDGIFHSINGERRSIQFIQDIRSYDISFRPTQGLYALRLPYKTRFEFWIILPFANYPIENVIQSLTTASLYDIKLHFQKIHSQIKFPIFTSESYVNGMDAKQDAFVNSDFQFKTGFKSSVGSIVQKAKITINTGGTFTALGTFSDRVPVSNSTSTPMFVFNADRPFVYAVVADGILPVIIGHYTV